MDDSAGVATGGAVAQQWQLLLQLTIAYSVGLMWFYEGLFGVWEDIIRYNYFDAGGWLTRHGIVPATGLADNDRHLAVMAAAGWHTILVMFGFVVGNTLKHLPTTQRLLLGTSFLGSALAGLYMMTCHGFDNNLWGVRSVAVGLRWPTNIDSSSHYLGCLATATQTGWLACAMALASADKRDVGYCPEVVARYLPRVAIFYVMTFAFFQFACVPFWDALVRYSVLASGDGAPASGRVEGDFGSYARLASATHTLTTALGVTSAHALHSLLRRLLPGNPAGMNSSASQAAVLVALIALFSFIFSLWVQYAIAMPVAHVARFAAAFCGPDAVAEAAKLRWSTVHTVVMSSYVTWFASGVVFEQCWGGSASNTGRGASQRPSRGPGGFSAKLLTLVITVVMLPMTWLTGVAGFAVMLVLLWPQPRTKNPRVPKAMPDAYLRVDWKKAVADCPKTGVQYLVIGVGFVGVSLVKRMLERGETRIRCLDMMPTNPFEGDTRVEYIRGNVCKPADLDAACKGVDTVIATFAKISFTERLELQAPPSIAVNITGTKNVAEACKRAGVKYLVQTSTSNVMACPKIARLDPPMTEDPKDSPYVTRDISHNHYSWTKAEAEKIVIAANCKELKTVAVRPCSGVFGAFDRTLVQLFLRHKVLVMPAPSCKIDYIFCENVVLGHLKAEARLREGKPGVAGEAFNITNEDPITFEELMMTIQWYHGPGLYILPAPKLILQVGCYITYGLIWLTGGKICPYLGPDLTILTPPSLQTAAMPFTCSNEKARRVLNYQPLWNIDEAVQQSLAEMNVGPFAGKRKLE